MNILTKTALCVMSCGAVIFAAGFAASGFDITKLSDVEYNYTEESFTFDGDLDLDFEALYDDVKIGRSPDDMIRITCQNGGNIRYTSSESDGVAVLRSETAVSKQKAWFTFMNIDFSADKKPPLTILLPENYSGSVNAVIDSGKLEMWGCSAESFTLKQLYGNAEIEHSEFGSFAAEMDSGNFSAESSSISDSFELNSLYGKFELEECVLNGGQSITVESGSSEISDSIFAGSFTFKSSYGNVDISESVFEESACVYDSNGSIELEDCVFGQGGRFETAYGNIKGVIKGSEEYYSIISEASYGSSSLKTEIRDGKPVLELRSDSGNIDVKFKDK
ncbi:MAG: DUF4097 domain-containing protein [Oscillospiraceae bacterium]|nr:DUF4097 domain-containing protein [Oscillospiraceae bacterium]